MRTFIAVDIYPTKEMRDALHYITQNLIGLKIKYVDLNNLHMTLAFLGEIPEPLIKAISSELSLLKADQIELSLQGLSVFKSSQNPQAIWIAMKPNEKLELLWMQVNKIIKDQGHELEKRSFSPHITIGRVKKIHTHHNLSQILTEYKNYDFGNMVIPEFILYQSILTPEGSKYNPLCKFALKP